jgi:hypothetical protein
MIKDEEESLREFHQWLREFALATRALDVATRRAESPLSVKVHAAIGEPLDIEKPGFHQLAEDSRAGGGDGTYPQNPESTGIFRMLVFLQYGVTFRELIRQIDVDKNPKAHRKLIAVHRNYWKVLSGVPFNKLKLKFEADHFNIMVHGHAFGLHKLSSEELSDCLDEICPCGQRHSPDYFKKLRIRVKQACDLLT